MEWNGMEFGMKFIEVHSSYELEGNKNWWKMQMCYDDDDKK